MCLLQLRRWLLLRRYRAGKRKFPYASLRGANLIRADLRGADLVGIDLGKAKVQAAL